MSGPKAFRIVTRAEIISICRRNLARLDAAIEVWTSRCQQNGTIDQADIDKVLARRDELRRLLAADRFIELQKQVPAEISYLQTDAERRADAAAEAEARSKRDTRRNRVAARALLARLESAGIDIPTNILNDLTVPAASSDRLNSAISKGLLLLDPTSRVTGAIDLQRDHAGRLDGGEQRVSLEEWISRQPAVEDRALRRVDEILGELKGLGVDPSPFSARISALEAEAPARWAVVADSLLLDLAAAVKNGREHVRALADLRERYAELSEMSSLEAGSLRLEIGEALSGIPPAKQSDLIKRADLLIEAEVHAIAAEERRRVVLEGLATLGYEVSEGMKTLWVNEGRVVLRKSANPGYGVELSGGSQADLLQVRTVAIGSPTEARDTNRDKDMETIWCDEFGRLQALVAESGGAVSIQAARPIGEFPLKIVSDLPVLQDATVVKARHLAR